MEEMEKAVEEKVTSMEEALQSADVNDKDAKKFSKRAPKRKVCVFCADTNSVIDYKDVAKIRKFMTEKGKILPSRQTNLCAKHQRVVANAIKRARYMALMPYKAD